MVNKNIVNLLVKSWSVSWPMILIMVFEFFISLTDVYIAGKVGKEVQASIGLVSQIYFIFIVVANAITVGSVSLISRLFTASDKKELSSAIYSILVATGFFGVILSLLGIFLSGPIINSLKIPQSVKLYAAPLIQIYAFGLMFHYFLVNTNGILRATAKIKISLLSMGVAAVTNIMLNFLFVFYTPLGFRGIALSTVTGVFLAALINMYNIKKFLVHKSFVVKFVRRVFKIGWPSGVLQISWQFGSTVLFLIIASLPEKSVDVMAALTNGLRIEAAIFLPAFAFNMANAVLVGNILGENKKEDAFKSGFYTAIMGTVLIAVITLIIIVFARNIAGFLSDNANVVKESVTYLYISMISEPFMAFGVILSGGLNGAGDTKSVMIRIIASLWLIRIPLAFILGIVLNYGPAGIWWSMNISIFIQCFLIGKYYFKRRWLLNEI
jgi:putative MATE family efflux protein